MHPYDFHPSELPLSPAEGIPGDKNTTHVPLLSTPRPTSSQLWHTKKHTNSPKPSDSRRPIKNTVVGSNSQAREPLGVISPTSENTRRRRQRSDAPVPSPTLFKKPRLQGPNTTGFFAERIIDNTDKKGIPNSELGYPSERCDQSGQADQPISDFVGLSNSPQDSDSEFTDEDRDCGWGCYDCNPEKHSQNLR